MSMVFYDREGNAIAYSEDDVHIYTFAGRAVAYLKESSVYSFSGAHLGRFEKGWIRDNRGAAVFFTEMASGPYVKPIKKVKPLKAPRQILPGKGFTAPKPLRPIDSLAWAEASGEKFFG
jgi:hypothetical protein